MRRPISRVRFRATFHESCMYQSMLMEVAAGRVRVVDSLYDVKFPNSALANGWRASFVLLVSTLKLKFPTLEKGENKILAQTTLELEEYFAGKRRSFSVPLVLEGTPFQKRAWAALSTIPFGKTATYGEQAVRIRKPSAVRAVGRANGLNRISILIPCHRVIGSNGSLTGYAGGIKAKQALLALEGALPER